MNELVTNNHNKNMHMRKPSVLREFEVLFFFHVLSFFTLKIMHLYKS